MKALWDKCLIDLKASVKPHEYKTWLKDLKPINIDSQSITLRAKDRIVKEYVEKNYLPLIKEISSKVFGKYLTIKLSLTDNVNQPLQLELNFKPKNQSIKSNLNPKYTFESFVVGSSNQFAHAAAVAVAENPGKAYNPLFIYGGVGLGKTHLMQAIGNFVKSSAPSKTVVYVTTEQFMNDLINSIRNDRMNGFREKYRTVDVLLIDDIQFISGKDRTQIEFFHTFNALYDAGNQVIMTSDRTPKEIPMLTERLRSRFEWGLIADIQPPDYETRIAILKRKADLENINVSDDILKLLASVVRSNIRQLEGSLIKLKAKAQLEGKPIDEKLVKNLFSTEGIQNMPQNNLFIDDIKRMVAEKFNVKENEFNGSSRKKEIAMARQVAMYLSRKLGSFSFPKIASAFNRDDHTTVMHAVKKIDGLRKKDDKLNRMISELEEKLSKLIHKSCG